MTYYFASSIALYTVFEDISCRLASAEIASLRLRPSISVKRQNSLYISMLLGRSVSCSDWSAGSTTSVISPFSADKFFATTEIGPLTNCSCFFVSSRPRATWRSPRSSCICPSNLPILCGASKITSGLGSSASFSSHLARAFDLDGGNPTKRNCSLATPDAERAARTALAPGTASTRSPRSSAAATRRVPGSETVGVPASETSAIDWPAESLSSRVDCFRPSL